MYRKKTVSVKSQSDEDLFIAIQNGNTEIFNELYNRYSNRLLYYFYRMLGNDKCLAQDFLQEIFFKIIDKPYLFDSNKHFSTWIFSIAHNMCKNEYRSKEIRKIVVKNENPDEFCDSKTEAVEYAQLITSVFKELEGFDENHRTAFLLKYREGFSVEEISETLNLAPGTVKSRLFYTRKKLQKILEGKYSEILENLF